mgnify:CR=1 FL=1
MTQTTIILIAVIFGLIVLGLCIRDIIRILTDHNQQ